MTWLPIAERELSVAARKRSTFWLRVSAGLVAIALGLVLMSVHAFGGMGAGQAGVALFRTLTWLLFAAALGGGVFFTSDSISEEKREGTIGFLFLTDLKGYDVVLGKLLATSLRAASGILVAFPVLSVTLLMGGVSGAQFWMTALAILATLLCSASAGLFISTLQKQAQGAFSGTMLHLFLWNVLGPLADLTLRLLHHPLREPTLSFTSPAVMFAAATQQGAPFWRALLWNLLCAGVLFAAACILVGRTWRSDSRTAERERTDYRKRYGSSAQRQKLRARYMDPNPVVWLCLRQRRQGLGPWLLGVAIFLMFGVLVMSGPPSGVWAVWSSANGLVALVLYAWTAFLAARFFVETRKNGFLELMLGCGIGPGLVVSAQWKGLIHTIGVPIAIIFGIQAIVAFVSFSATGLFGVATGFFHLFGVTAVLLGISASIANIAALSWFGMWMGLTSRNVNTAALRTLLFVQIVPWFAISFLSVFAVGLLMIPARIRGTATGMTSAFPLVMAAVPSALVICKDILFISWSRRRLYSRLREQVAGASRWAAALPITRQAYSNTAPAPPIIQPPRP